MVANILPLPQACCSDHQVGLKYIQSWAILILLFPSRFTNKVSLLRKSLSAPAQVRTFFSDKSSGH